jgi:hypothetical protein
MGFASFEAARRAEAQVMDAALPLALHARARLGEDVPRVLPVDHARFQAASGLLRGGEDRWMARPSLVAAALEQAASSVSGQGADASIEARSARCRQVLGLAVVGFRADAPERVASAAALVAEAVLAQPAECADRAWVEGFLRTAAERQVACNPRSVRGWARLAEWHVRAGDASAALAAAAQLPASAAKSKSQGKPVLMKAGQQHADDPETLNALAAFGVNNICSSLPSRKLDEKWSVDSLKALRDRVNKHGITLEMVPLPLSSAYITRAEYPAIMMGKSPDRDRATSTTAPRPG